MPEENWEKMLKEEWSVTRTKQEREFLLHLYQPRIAGLPNHRLEKLFAELRDEAPEPRGGA
jgi:hypothetical protein